MDVKTTPAVNVEQLIARNRELITKLPQREAEALVRSFIGNDRIARMTGTVRDEDMW